MSCFHWTTNKNAQRILEEGLNIYSFIAPYSFLFSGEVCLKIKYEIDWSKRTEADTWWQAITHKHVYPCDIETYILL